MVTEILEAIVRLVEAIATLAERFRATVGFARFGVFSPRSTNGAAVLPRANSPELVIIIMTLHA